MFHQKPSLYFPVRKLCGAAFIDYHVALGLPFGLSLAALAPAYGLYLQFGSTVVSMIGGVAVGGVMLLASYILWNREFLYSLRDIIRHKKPAL